MDFSGPQPADFADVRSLNKAFLRCLRGVAAGSRMRRKMPEAAGKTVLGLGEGEIARLAQMPMLLASVREYDDGYWRDLLDSEPTGRLAEDRYGTPEVAEVTATTVAFLWQLARHNPYAARLVSGATLGWCERLTGCTLQGVLWRVRVRDDLLEPRFATDAEAWQRLLGAGLSPLPEVRRAARMSMLQRMLTGQSIRAAPPRRAAACKSAVPSFSIAGKPGQP
jgi:hypothetical protein